MKCIFVDIEKFELEFFLFPDDIDDKIRKKLNNLGLPTLAIEWPDNDSNQVNEASAGVFEFGEYSRNGLSILEPTEDSKYVVTYNAVSHTVNVTLEGRYFCYNDAEVEGFSEGTNYLTGKTSGYVSGILLRDNKNKQIKTPKDAYGISGRLEALAVNPEYNNLCYQIKFTPIIVSGLFKDGQLVTGGF
jgi:hypothetical protein